MSDDEDDAALLDVDPFLLAIAVTLNSGDATSTIGLTVTVAGGTVTGDAIPYNRWRELVQDALRAELGYRGDALANVFDGLQRTLELGLRSNDPDGPPIPQMPSYLHLANARFLEAPSWGEGMLWRCRLDQVVAWSLEAPALT